MRWFVKEHACKRFVERIDDTFTKQEARDIIEKALRSNAARLKRDSVSGAHRYLLAKPRCVAIVIPPSDVWSDVHEVCTIVSATGDCGATWRPSTREPRLGYVEEHHPDWNDLRDETRPAISMMLLRVVAKTDARGPVEAWVRRCA